MQNVEVKLHTTHRCSLTGECVARLHWMGFLPILGQPRSMPQLFTPSSWRLQEAEFNTVLLLPVMFVGGGDVFVTAIIDSVGCSRVVVKVFAIVDAVGFSGKDVLATMVDIWKESNVTESLTSAVSLEANLEVVAVAVAVSIVVASGAGIGVVGVEANSGGERIYVGRLLKKICMWSFIKVSSFGNISSCFNLILKLTTGDKASVNFLCFHTGIIPTIKGFERLPCS